MKISSNNAIIVALLVSVLVHGVLLLDEKHDSGDMSIQRMDSVTVSVELIKPVPVAQESSETEVVSSEKIVAVSGQLDPLPEPRQKKQPRSTEQQNTDVPVEADLVSDYSDPQPERQHQQKGQRADELRKFVYEAINREKHYPYMARRQRREGLVKLNFVMHPDGKVTDIAIVQSSRFDILDKAARRAVESISPFHLAAEYLTMQQHYDVGIEFRLN